MKKEGRKQMPSGQLGKRRGVRGRGLAKEKQKEKGAVGLPVGKGVED